MKQIYTKNWKDLQEAIADLTLQISHKRENSLYHSPLLFRGQSNSNWTLRTTLERIAISPVSLDEYFRIVSLVKPKLEAFTGSDWEFDRKFALNWSKSLPYGEIPGYEFLVFLRHHGFPSPLLDWTASPQIASFFAFRDVGRDAESVSIYAFCEHAGSGKIRSSNTPSISSFGPNTRAHSRHFVQKSEYTICTVFDGEVQLFASHEDAVGGPSADDRRRVTTSAGLEEDRIGEQDLMWKINVPATERATALRHMAEYNLNAFSLFSSTESLAETLGLEYFGPATFLRR